MQKALFSSTVWHRQASSSRFLTLGWILADLDSLLSSSVTGAKGWGMLIMKRLLTTWHLRVKLLQPTIIGEWLFLPVTIASLAH